MLVVWWNPWKSEAYLEFGIDLPQNSVFSIQDFAIGRLYENFSVVVVNGVATDSW